MGHRLQRQTYQFCTPLLQQRIGTGDNIVAEASPRDRIWGIGFMAEDKLAFRPPLWPRLTLSGGIPM